MGFKATQETAYTIMSLAYITIFFILLYQQWIYASVASISVKYYNTAESYEDIRH